MTKAIAHTYNVAHEYRRQITTLVLVVCAFVACGYAINLYRVISHAVALQHVTAQVAVLDADIQHLDAQYLKTAGKISVDTISSYGFNQGTVTAFISRSASLGRVALAAHEL